MYQGIDGTLFIRIITTKIEPPHQGGFAIQLLCIQDLPSAQTTSVFVS
jgi:hypothetical protein